MAEPTPLSVVGGFLGSGKTTLLNHVLRDAAGVRYAVLVNDFGEIAIDDRLVVDHDGETISFANGCLCCTLGDSLIDTVDRLLAAESPPDQLLVEASGVADPTAIADVATLHPDLRRDITLVLCDATSIRARAADVRLADTVERQLAAADVLVMNHCDRLRQGEVEETRDWLLARTGRRAVAADHARIDLTILDAGLSPERERAAPGHRHTAEPHPIHTRVIRADAPRDASSLREGLLALGPEVVRAKGMLRDPVDPRRWWIAQKVGEHVEVRVAPAAVGRGESALVLLALEPLPRAETLAGRLGLVAASPEETP